MDVDQRLLNILLEWEEAAARGQPLSSEAACRDHPELLGEFRRRVADLQKLQSLIELSVDEGPTTKQLDDPDSTPVWRTPGRGAAADAADVSSPTRYRPLRFHAKGGLGEVYVAEDEELRREVALKRIQPRRAADAESRQRFLREAVLTARLDHPGVVPVHGLVRAADGELSYAMRFVEGETLREAIRRFHEADTSDRDAGERLLAFRGLLNRFIAACNTVAYAHSKGIIHRDLKPANIMLGRYGETLVLDWGLARSVGESRAAGGSVPAGDLGDATRTGDLMGTPAYMSPEQAAGQWALVGPPSDVYSLGATLYTLLTGAPPFGGGQALADVEAGRFPPPRRKKSRTPAALEAVCLRAMALRAEDRYGTARELADDVERWLADEPVRAYQEPWRDRARRWRRRHRPLVMATAGATAVALLGLTIGLVVVARANSSVRAARDKAVARELEAREQRAEAERQRDRARSHFVLARSAVDRYHTQVSESPELKAHGLETLRRRLLESAVEFYQAFVRQEGTDPAVRGEQGRAYLRLADLDRALNRHAEADQAYQQAQAVFQTLAEGQPEYLQELASALHRQGSLYSTMGRLPEAEKNYQRAVTIREALNREHADSPRIQQELAQSYNDLAVLYMNTSRNDQAFATYQKAFEVRRPLADSHPDVAEYQSDLATTYSDLGILQQYRGNPAEAERNFQQTAAIFEKLVASHPDVTLYQHRQGIIHNNLGAFYQERRQYDRAYQELQKALASYRRLAKSHPTVPEYQYDAAECAYNTSLAYVAMGRFPDALDLLRQALAAQERLNTAVPDVPDYQLDLAKSINTLGNLEYLLGRREALALCLRARPLFEALVRSHPGVIDFAVNQADNLQNLAALARDEGRSGEALDRYQQAFEVYASIRRREPNQEVVRYLQVIGYFGRAILLARAKRHVEAAEDLRQAQVLNKGENNPDLRAAQALVHAYAGDHAAAATDAEEVARDPAITPRALYEMGRAFALAAAAVRQDRKLSAAQRESLAKHYADRAVALLRSAGGAGFFAADAQPQALHAPEFAVLHDSPDFRQLADPAAGKSTK